VPWANDREARRRSDATYGTPEYRRNRAVAWRRAAGRCELTVEGRRCGSAKDCQVDHITPRSAGGTHALANLRVLCGEHHRAKTAQEGGGFRGGQAQRDPRPTPRTQW
jgi:5-methylcytosine-specific restriction endonuclease McrA